MPRLRDPESISWSKSLLDVRVFPERCRKFDTHKLRDGEIIIIGQFVERLKRKMILVSTHSKNQD
jgi:hypothetical protein